MNRLTLLVGVFFCSVVICMVTTFMKAIELMEHHENHVLSEDSIGNIPINAMVSVSAERLQHEDMFVNTLKECIPTTDEAEDGGKKKKKKKECKTFVPEGSKERIAVLAPPGKMSPSLSKFVRYVLAKGKKAGSEKVAMEGIEIVPNTHMAPYGYGKTHGYTRIVRVVPQPLLLGASDTLKAAIRSSSMSLNDVTLNDLKAALRQQIRYHCRLNHIAAHTAMWTIGFEDFAEWETDFLIEKAQKFFGLDLNQENLVNQVVAEYNKLEDDDGSNHGDTEEEDDDNSLARLDGMYRDGSRLMYLVQKKSKPKKRRAKSKKTNDILKMLDDVLLDEMKLSNNLTNWPCESFWTVGEPENRLELSPVIRSIAKAMSPNCTAPYTSCFVKKDRCEANGDGECK
eukprot:CAMPEP_0172360308 /NCGR_PEP_ID=MMETSP1060-20121228/4360_1 /TAXON_ID=37318 /ORGANISM="Pseudo-nitzschia pungens, Strain cf. cingulata" /LENGTH=397 /DNA_ID=CAMNT_0013082267 /DNA_START=230 /DNA_END=1423 /DNA_ORIENTATION=-